MSARIDIRTDESLGEVGNLQEGGNDVSREHAHARSDEDSLNGLEVMSSTMAFGLVLQTLSLLDATHKSTRYEGFTLVAIAIAEFAFVCSVDRKSVV